MDLSFQQRIAIPADILVRELEGESVLLNLKSERYFGLDEVGTRIWAVLAESTSIQEAYETLLSEYDVEPSILQQDLQALLEQLLDQGLIELQ